MLLFLFVIVVVLVVVFFFVLALVLTKVYLHTVSINLTNKQTELSVLSVQFLSFEIFFRVFPVLF